MHMARSWQERCPGSVVGAASLLLALSLTALASAQERSFFDMPTGNGHGFQVFRRENRRIESFLEHPYRYPAPATATRQWGTGRRDLAHDLYFGVRVGDHRVWLERSTGQSDVEYEKQSHIIHGASTEGGLSVDTYYFAPFGYEGNGLVALIRVRNDGSASAKASVFFKPNLKLGGHGDRREVPNDSGESVTFEASADPPYAVETGPGGGHAVYVPIGGFDHASCGADATLYGALGAGDAAIGNSASCTGAAQVMVFGRDLTVDAGAEAWWGLATLFVNDNPAVDTANDFKDARSVADIVSAWKAHAAGRDAKAVHDDALAEHEAFRKATMPPELSSQERDVWRQSETVLRMGQIREPLQENRENFGMVLASLPPGEWHTGWVRDMAYGVAALAMTGHHDMAKLGLDFFLGADGDTQGFFNNGFLGQTYRVSATRYFGNGKEEGDFNNDGPNVETDGWGLVLWAAGMYVHYSCDRDWLDAKTWRGDTVYEGLSEVADDILQNLEGDLPKADASIWEVHWDRRKVFTYTAAAHARGLYDFAHIAADRGDTERAAAAREAAEKMQARILSALVYAPQNSLASHLGVAGNPISADGSTAEALMWNLVETDDPIYGGTLASFSRLNTPFGGYQRLEPQLSLTGESGANLYDTSEWILLDLRIGQAFRRKGDHNTADARLDWVSSSAAVNDDLIPELYERTTGTYEGVVPMVGYGAGAWMMTQMEKHGTEVPRHDKSLEHCDMGGIDPGGGSSGDGDGDGPGSDDDGSAVDGDGAGDGDGPQGNGDLRPVSDEAASFCALAPRARNAELALWAWGALGLLLLRRRSR